MIKDKNSIFIRSLILAIIVGAAAYNCAAQKIISKNKKTSIRAITKRPVRVVEASAAKNRRLTKNSAGAVVRNYELNNFKDGAGFVNLIKMTDTGAAKMSVLISGSYVDQTNETRIFKETETAGEAILSGKIARATLIDEAGKKCRADIIFGDRTATVKVSEACRFKIKLNGVYLRIDDSVLGKTSENSALTEISYGELGGYTKESYAHQVGEKFVIRDVPADRIHKKISASDIRTDFADLFWLEARGEESSPENTLLVSKKMIAALDEHATDKPSSLRMTAVLIEASSEYQINRLAFVIKIEGIDRNGRIIWTAIGDEPEKIHFIQ